MAVRSLCVLCGSREGFDPVFRETAARLGALLARHGIRLIYGGGSIGLMGVVADAALAGGGAVVGVIPDFLIRYEVGHHRLTELVVTRSMHERKRLMFEMADAYCVLPGGLGTLDETFEILTWKQIRLHDAPVVILDTAGYWQELRALLEKVITTGFADASVMDLCTVAVTPEQVLDLLAKLPAGRTPVASDQT